MSNTAVYAGSFDPITNGHINIIQRGRALFDKVVIAVATNTSKKHLFEIDERIKIIRKEFSDDPCVEVDTFSGLLVNYAREKKAKTILRGLRSVSDFEYEIQMASMNRKLAPDIETIFLMSEGKHFFVSSRLVKEVAMLGGSIDDVVPERVAEQLYAKFNTPE
jgi:pantetheine-phosphate adenylyltransferase